MSAEKFIEKFNQVRTSFMRDQKKKFMSFLKFILKNASYVIEYSYNEHDSKNDYDLYNPNIIIKVMKDDGIFGKSPYLTIHCYNHKTVIDAMYTENDFTEVLQYSVLDDDELLDIIIEGQKKALKPDEYQEDNKNLNEFIKESVVELGIERQFKINNFLEDEDDGEEEGA